MDLFEEKLSMFISFWLVKMGFYFVSNYSLVLKVHQWGKYSYIYFMVLTFNNDRILLIILKSGDRIQPELTF